jgi:tetratricopeptide (TPR) repeat protein
MKYFTVLYYIFFIPFFAVAQNNNIDSFYNQLSIAANDTTRIDLLNQISRQNYLSGKSDEIIPSANKALILAQKINYTKGILSSYKNIASAYMLYAENQKALEYFEKALKLSRELSDKKSEADVLGNMGLINESQDDFQLALEKILLSLEIREKIGDKKGIASSYNYIGIIYSDQNNNKKSLEYYYKSLEIRKELNDKIGIAELYNNLGVVYIDQKKIDSAITIFRKSLEIEKELQLKEGIALAYNNLGLCFRIINKNDSALFYHKKSLAINEEMKNKKGIALANYNVGADFLNIGDLNNAIHFAEKSLNISLEINNLYTQQSANSLLGEIYEKGKDFKRALFYKKIYSQISDSIYNLESQKNMAEMNIKYETEKKDKELIKLEKEKQIKQLEIDRQKSEKHQLVIILLAAFFIITSLGIFTLVVKKTSNKLVNTNKILIKKNIEIDKKKKEINMLAIQIARFQSQMNPHFIFNALNGMQAAILKKDFDQSLNQIQTFSKLTLNLSEQDYITLESEQNYLNKYISFEHQRFVNKFSLKYNLDPQIEISKTLIPPMLLQPIIENSIKHAGLNKIQDGAICVNIFISKTEGVGDLLRFEISDNGSGFNTLILNSNTTSKGLYITKQRIKIALENHEILKTDHYFSVNSNSDAKVKGTFTTFYLPYKIGINA